MRQLEQGREFGQQLDLPPLSQSVVHVVRLVVQQLESDVVEGSLHESGVADVVRQGELEPLASDLGVSTQVNVNKSCELLVIPSRECVGVQHPLDQREDLHSLPVHEGVLLGPLECVQGIIV